MKISEITEQQKIDALAELDGWVPFPHKNYKGGILLPYKYSKSATEHCLMLPDYLNSYDAIIPLIQTQIHGDDFMLCACEEHPGLNSIIYLKPSQLCDVFLISMGIFES